MALTIAILDAEHEELALGFDAPRIAIGRSKSCELSLPDPSVSKRHASIRQEGGRSYLVDEGSANGVAVGRTRIPPQTPYPIADGQIVRVGRVWLRIQLSARVASSPADARRIARELMRRQLSRAGETSVATIAAASHPPLRLVELSHEYVIGRGKDCALVLDDDRCSRHHLAVFWRADGWSARDLGSKQGSFCRAAQPGASESDEGGEEEPIDERGRPWRDGEVVRAGGTLLTLRDPVSQALAESLLAAEVRMRPEELREAPPGSRDRDHDRDHDHDRDRDHDHDHDRDHDSDRRGPGVGIAALDTVVVLVALGLLALSAAGLFWLLR